MATFADPSTSHDFGWIAPTIGKARWIPFTIDKEIIKAFTTPCPRATETHVYTNLVEAVAEWADDARESIINWIVGELLGSHIERAAGSASRADQFRSLGRGWIFVLINRQKRCFRWWFESIARVRTLSLSGRLLLHVADHFLVQWPQLTQRYPKARFIGRLC